MSPVNPTTVASDPRAPRPPGGTGNCIHRGVGHFRWVICTLLLFGVTKNYMDRQVLGVLKTTLQHDLGWNEIDYSNLVFVFQGTYAVGMVVVGRLVDHLGTRLGYFPASIKTVAEWFPSKERALATGIFNAGTNIGAILTPLIVPWITIHWGWRLAFVATGALGFVWLVFWLLLYRPPESHPRLSKAELEYIASDRQQVVPQIQWLELLPHPQTWAFAVGQFTIDPIWWFLLFWIPDFLQRNHGLKLMQLGLPIMVIYLLAHVGSVAGGWLSSWMIHRGHSVNMARKSAMLICALVVVPIAFAYRIESIWGVVLLIGLAAAAHQGFSANLFTLTSDLFPAQAVGSVVGIGGMAGAIVVMAKIVGYVLQWTGSYKIPFLIAGSAYFLALALVQVLSPRLDPARIH